MQILSAREFIDQGTSASAVLSIAEFHLNKPRPDELLAEQIHNIARDVAAITGAPLSRQPRTKARNDNRRHGERRVA